MRLLAASAVTAAALMLTGCPNPNDIGVQIYGSIKATATDASSGQPVGGALVNAGSTNTCTTDATGTCILHQVPVGKWTVIASAPGLHGSAEVSVAENTQAVAAISMGP